MITRRAFIRTIGKGSAAVALVGVAACSTEEPTATTLGAPTTPAPESTTTSVSATSATSNTATTEVSEPGMTSEEWRRVNLGFVSAYVFVRGGEAALVDTGIEGSAPQIESTLGDLGLGWSDLSTILLTHHHGDHVGSLPDIMEAAPGATAYAGAEDIPNITSPRPVSAVADGDTVFGLLQPVGVAGPPAQFTADPVTANESIVKLGGLEYDVIYFGHGEPVTSNGSDQVAEFAAGL